jgi:hypothetical protein
VFRTSCRRAGIQSNTGTCLNHKFSWPAGLAHRKDFIPQIVIDWVREKCTPPGSRDAFQDVSSRANIDWNERGFFSLCEPDGRLELNVGQRITHVKFNPTGQTGHIPECLHVKVGDGWIIEAGL